MRTSVELKSTVGQFFCRFVDANGRSLVENCAFLRRARSRALTATSGEVVVAGTPLTRLGEDQLARFRRGTIGIVFQSFHLIETMTALENVAVPLELNGIADAFDRAREELASVGLVACHCC